MVDSEYSAAGASPPEVVHVRLSSICPCPENDDIYSARTWDDPDIQALSESIQKRGVMEPLTISSDNVIISGHRRHFAALYAGLKEVPVIIRPISYKDDREEFLRLLVEANSQRKKTSGMIVREAAMKLDPEIAHAQIEQERREKDIERIFSSKISDRAIDPESIGSRKKISAAKMPLLEAAKRVIEDNIKFWPLSVRQIHYQLLGPAAPLRHASKPASRYVNNQKCYSDLCDLLARGRVEGFIPWESIDDETRPEDLNSHYWNSQHFLETELTDFLRGYYRNRQQSQVDHIEIVAEKLTVKTILEGVAKKFSIPLTIGRGMSGPTVKKKIYDRFEESSKRKLIILVVSDLDPAGDAIAEDMRKAFERDFGLDSDEIEAYKVALSFEHIEEFDLEPSMEAKSTSPTYNSFVERHGITDAYELEALRPSDLQRILEDAILDVIDVDSYNAELARERQESSGIVALKNAVVGFLKDCKLGDEALA